MIALFWIEWSIVCPGLPQRPKLTKLALTSNG
jgi:hypothetical protein